MRLDEIIGGLTPAEKQALGALERSGRWGLMYDARIEDGWNSSGQRSRTFQRQGRYQLVLMLDPGKPHPATGLFDEPKVEPVAELQEVVSDFVSNSPTRIRPIAWVDVPAEKPIEPVKAEEPKPESEPEPQPARVNVKKKKRGK